MKKIFSVLMVGLLFLVYACGGGGGDDPKSVMSDIIKVSENFFADLDKANDADGVVTAITNYAESMQKMKPRIKALHEKFPGLKDMKAENLPPELKELEGKIKELEPKFMGAMGKLMKYASDPKVMEATKKMQEAMKSFE